MNLAKHNELSEKELRLLKMELEKRGKDKVIAWVLWCLLGVYGGHRYYIGHKTSAIFMTITSVISIVALTMGIITVEFMLGAELISEDDYNTSLPLIAPMALGLMVYLGVVVWSLIDAINLSGVVNSINEEVEERLIAEIKEKRELTLIKE